MKLLIITMLTLVSSVAMADGFRCQSADFRVKLYNQTRPEDGTRNPAVLVVSERDLGTIALLNGEEIVKTNGSDFVTYEGQVNGKQDGRFVSVKLAVAKQAEEEGVFAGFHVAKLTVNANGETRTAILACERYLKGARE